MFFFKSKKQKEHDRAVCQVLERINKKSIGYVTERLSTEDGSNLVLGKNGAINVVEGEIVIVCNGKIVFRCDTENVDAGELMSQNGVMIYGYDRDCKRRRCVIAYYSYR